jgi:glycosyltransferase involved in cell wall biosynthesis
LEAADDPEETPVGGVDVSVIVPVKDAAATLGDCLRAALAQEAAVRFEVIVVDNGSSDSSRAIATELGARVVTEGSPGAYAARNAGIRAARGSILLFTDADCIPAKGWLCALLTGLERADAAAAGGAIVAAPPRSLLEAYSARAGILSQEHALRHRFLPFFQTANAAFRRSVFDRIGPFDERFTTGGDADLMWRLQTGTDLRWTYVPDAVVLHRHRANLRSLWAQFEKYGRSDVALLRKYKGRLRPSPAKLGLDALRLLLSLPLAAVFLLLLPFSGPLPALSPLLRAFRVLARRYGQLRAWLGGA